MEQRRKQERKARRWKMLQNKMRLQCRKSMLAFIRLSVLVCILAGAWKELSVLAEAESENDEEMFFQVLFSESGGSGYYCEKPEVTIERLQENVRICFLFTDANGNVLKDCMGDEEAEILRYVLDQDLFAEGENRLKVWAETIDDEMVMEDSVQEYIFLVDTISPSMSPIQYPPQAGQQIFIYNSAIELLLSAEDSGSGIQAIYYSVNDDEFREMESFQAKVALPNDFRGKVKAYCVDLAGNQSNLLTSEEMICDANVPQIDVSAPKGFDQWYQNETTISLNVTDKELSSGLMKIHCRVNGIPVFEKSWSAEDYKTNYSMILPVREMSQNGSRVPIAVEVWDQAGNQAIWSGYVLIDGQMPEIKLTGIEDGEITSVDVLTELRIYDDNVLGDAEVSLTREGGNGEAESLLISPAESASGTKKYSLDLSKDGKYRLNVVATDMAGHQIQKEYSFIIDKTDPVIQYVDQLDGVYLQYFEWNYRLDEIIWDLTEYTYVIQINDSPYIPGARYQKEGKCILKVQARDAVGNQTVAEAEFVIDRTKPNILFGDIINGEQYETGDSLVISTADAEDSISSIIVNGKEQNIDSNIKIFRFPLQTPGTYHIEVIARDAAKNEAYSQVSFEIVEKENVAEEVLDFAKRIVGIDVSAENEKVKGADKEGNDGNGYVVICGLGIVVIGLCACLGILKRCK